MSLTFVSHADRSVIERLGSRGMSGTAALVALFVVASCSSSCAAGDDVALPGDPPSAEQCGEPPDPVIPTWHSSPGGSEIMMSLESAQVIHDWYRDSVRWMSCARLAR
jgi:hypothetical protein